MRIIMISDTHGMHRNLEILLEKETERNMMFHMGDVEGGEYYIEETAQCPLHIVAGNNDFFTDLPREDEFILKGKRFWLTHGHSYYVSAGEDRIKKEARRRGVDVVVYGHTHRPSVSIEDDLLIMNPGSLSHPRQKGRRPSYIVMELREGKEPDIEIKYL